MKSPLAGRELREFESLESTQLFAKELVDGGCDSVGAVLAHEQSSGRGRLGRSWISPPGASLSVSFTLWDYADWSAPELIGMACGLAAAIACDCQIAWPNDLMLDGKKVGGALTELHRDRLGRTIPIVGVGINLSTFDLPLELVGRVGFLNSAHSPDQLAHIIANSLMQIPDPKSWHDLRELWLTRDCTVGKQYKLPDGSVSEAIRIAENGNLVVSSNGIERTIPSAEAWFG